MSADQSVFTPVSVTEGVVLIAPEVGEIVRVGVLTVNAAVAESVESEMVTVPVPDPVASMVMVPTCVDVLTDWLTTVQVGEPVATVSLKVVPLTHAVFPLPVSVRTMFLE